MSTKAITLELTQDEAILCLDAVRVAQMRLREYIRLREKNDDPISPQAYMELRAYTELSILDCVVSMLQAKTGQYS